MSRRFLLKPSIISTGAFLFGLSGLPLPSHATNTKSIKPASSQQHRQNIRPQDDLYLAANQVWLATHRIPDDKSELYAVQAPRVVEQRLLSLLTELSMRKLSKNSDQKKLVDYYASYLNIDQLDARGNQAIAQVLSEIDGISDLHQLAAWQGKIHGVIKLPIWLWGGFADFSNPQIYRHIAMQGGLGLPSRELYLNEKPNAMRGAYLAYLTTLARSSGLESPGQVAQQVYAVERKIAFTHTAEAEAMNPAAIQTVAVNQLDQFAPGFPWMTMMEAAKVDEGDSINLMQAKTAKTIAKLYQEIPLSDWKLYFKLRMLNEMAPVAPESYRRAHHEFHGKFVGGLSAEPSRQLTAISELSTAMNETLAKAYVERYFPAGDKQRVQQMIKELISAAKTGINESSILSNSSRHEALAKLDKMKARVAYPETWRNYDKLEIIAGDAVGNQHRAKRFEWERQASLSKQKIDRNMWMMSPLEVNAYYDPSLNEINLPAAFLQAPMFDPKGDDATNYGRLGAFIGHEISHAFDNVGSQFNSDGLLKNWWTEEDTQRFQAKANQLIAFYDKQEVLPGKFVNGNLTLPENMADILGVQMAFRAYRNVSNPRLKTDQQRDQGAQKFFIENAKNWAILRRDERTLQLLTTDVHSPNKVRSNATVMHVDGFHQAFKTQASDKLFLAPDQRFRIW